MNDEWEWICSEQKELNEREDVLDERIDAYFKTHTHTAEELHRMIHEIPSGMGRYTVIEKLKQDFPEYWEELMARRRA